MMKEKRREEKQKELIDFFNNICKLGNSRVQDSNVTINEIYTGQGQYIDRTDGKGMKEKLKRYFTYQRKL